MNNALTVRLFRELVGDKFFGVEFIKKNGERRVMNCRLGVQKGITGKGMSYDPTAKGLVPVFERNTNAFRIINLNTLCKLRARGKVYDFEKNDVYAAE